jgi:hypothetical protein
MPREQIVIFVPCLSLIIAGSSNRTLSFHLVWASTSWIKSTKILRMRRICPVLVSFDYILIILFLLWINPKSVNKRHFTVVKRKEKWNLFKGKLLETYFTHVRERISGGSRRMGPNGRRKLSVFDWSGVRSVYIRIPSICPNSSSFPSCPM